MAVVLALVLYCEGECGSHVRAGVGMLVRSEEESGVEAELARPREVMKLERLLEEGAVAWWESMGGRETTEVRGGPNCWCAEVVRVRWLGEVMSLPSALSREGRVWCECVDGAKEGSGEVICIAAKVMLGGPSVMKRESVGDLASVSLGRFE